MLKNPKEDAARWRETALKTLKTANNLRNQDDYRSCVSRAYYAAYQAATFVCIRHGDAGSFASGWNNPSHLQLPELIGNNGDLPPDARRKLKTMLKQLRDLRESADYRMGYTVNDQTMREALLLANKIFERLKIMETLELTAADVAERVRPYLAKMVVDNITFALDKIKWNDFYWEIWVRPSRASRFQYPISDALNALAGEMEAKEGFAALVIPGDPLVEEDSRLSGADPCGDCPRLSYAEMSQASRKLTAAEVAARVRPYVAKWTLDDITFSVVEVYIHLEFDFWRVPIRPSREPKHHSRYIEELIDLTHEIEDCEGFFLTLDNLDPLTEE